MRGQRRLCWSQPHCAWRPSHPLSALRHGEDFVGIGALVPGNSQRALKHVEILRVFDTEEFGRR